MPKKTIIYVTCGLKNFIKRADDYVIRCILVANRTYIDSCWIICKRMWRNNIIHSFISFTHCPTIFKFFILWNKSIFISY